MVMIMETIRNLPRPRQFLRRGAVSGFLWLLCHSVYGFICWCIDLRFLADTKMISWLTVGLGCKVTGIHTGIVIWTYCVRSSAENGSTGEEWVTGACRRARTGSETASSVVNTAKGPASFRAEYYAVCMFEQNVTDLLSSGWRLKFDYDVTYNNMYFCTITLGLSWGSVGRVTMGQGALNNAEIILKSSYAFYCLLHK
jgi:hypothetical protein